MVAAIRFIVVRHVIVVHFVEREIWIALLYACNNRIMLLLCFLVECIPICPNFKGIRNMQGEQLLNYFYNVKKKKKKKNH